MQKPILRCSIIISALLVFFMFFSTKAFCQNENEFSVQDKAIRHYEKGYDFYRLGKFNQAEDHLITALETEPNLIKAHYWLGKLYREQGRLEDAIFHWEEVERLKQLIRSRRAALAIENNEYPSYAQMLKVAQTTREARVFYEKAMNLIDQGHWDGAEVELRKAVELYPGNSRYVLQLARLLWDKNEKQASIKFYRDLLMTRDIGIEDFSEGIHRMIAADMSYVASPLMREKQEKFSGNKVFAKLQKMFEIEVHLAPIIAGKIVQKLNGQVVINMGMRDGLSLSDEYKLTIKSFKPGDPIHDPESGKALGRAPEKTSGELLLTKVYQNTSWALIRKEYGPGVKAGDLIELKKTVR